MDVRSKESDGRPLDAASHPGAGRAAPRVLRVRGERGVATSATPAWGAGGTPSSLTEPRSTVVTSKLAVPRIATGNEPMAPTFKGFGQVPGLMSTGTARAEEDS